MALVPFPSATPGDDEDPAFDDAAGARVARGQDVKRIVERDDFVEFERGQQRHLPVVQGLGHAAPSAFEASACARMIHEDASHRDAGDSQEAVAIARGQLLLAEQAQVDLVDQGRRRQRLRRFACDV